MLLYLLLHYFFLIFHALFTIFNCFGWMTAKTRLAHLITMCLTAFSWFVVGFWRGWGYCFCTDWHFDVLGKLGRYPASSSYIHYLILEVTGIDLNETLVIDCTLYIFIALIVITILVHGWPRMKRRMAGRIKSRN